MTKRIYNYTIGLGSVEAAIDTIPQNYRFLHLEAVMAENSRTGEPGIKLWYEVDSEYRPRERHYRIVMTGEVVPNHGTYLGTAIFSEGAYVLHV